MFGNWIRGVGPCSSCDIPGCLGVKSNPSWNQWWSKKSVWFQKFKKLMSQSQSRVIRGNKLDSLWQKKQNYHSWKGGKQTCDLHNCIRTFSWFSHYKHCLPLHLRTRTITATKLLPAKRKKTVRFQWNKISLVTSIRIFCFWDTKWRSLFTPEKVRTTDSSTGACVPRFQRCSFFEGKKGTIYSFIIPYSLPKSSEYLVRRCLEPLKAFRKCLGVQISS